MNNKHQLTKEGYDKISERLKFLKDVERPRIIEALKDARAQGDLSENAEYDAARDEQAKIEQEITELEDIIRNSEIIEEKGHTNNLGKEITIYFEDEKDTLTFTLVSSFLESDPLKGIISRESPLGKAILEAEVGDKVLVKPDYEPEYYAIIKNIRKL
ncbi:MAG: transcription elongation factor GreA [Coprobacillus sp.]|nr:transcription elongation factor GreA [Coprobacillus sp.]MDY4144970.1 transcription elongation factor GreA [Bacilli bacterium]CCY06889.1 transcription elongation factor GreA [Coprobacillus sp. CAG:698]